MKISTAIIICGAFFLFLTPAFAATNHLRPAVYLCIPSDSEFKRLSADPAEKVWFIDEWNDWMSECGAAAKMLAVSGYKVLTNSSNVLVLPDGSIEKLSEPFTFAVWNGRQVCLLKGLYNASRYISFTQECAAGKTSVKSTAK